MSFFVRLFRRGAGSCSPIIEVRKSVYTSADVKELPVQLAAVATDSTFVYSQDACVQRFRGVSRRIAIDMPDGRGSTIPTADDLSCTSTSSVPDLERYSIINSLHKSRYSTLYFAEDKITGNCVVLKVYNGFDMTASQLLKLKSETTLQQRCTPCSGVVELMHVMETEASTVLVMEHCSGGTLTEALSRCGWRFAEAQAAALAKTLLNTLSFLHEHNVVHRCIRPEHVLLTKAGQWKLADFGNAIDLQTDHLNSRVGHLLYTAPEVLLKPSPEEVFHEVLDKGLSEEELPSYDEKVDVWSLGVVICEVLTGRQPFLADSSSELFDEIHRVHCMGLTEYLLQYGLSAEAVSFLSQALTLDPAARKSVRALSQHPWIRKVLAP